MQKQQKTILFFSLLSVILGSPVYADGLGSKAEREILLNNEAVESISQASVVQVAGVQINPTPEGIEVILEVINGQIQADDIRQEGNTLLINIPNTVLILSDTQEFEQSNPIPEIELVRVISLPTEQVQVAITGSEAPPTAQVNIEAGNLVLTVMPTASAMTEEPSDTIEVVATQDRQEGSRYNAPTATTGTRIEAPLSDLPISVQVLPEELIEDRQVIRLQELADNVPGVETVSGYGGLPVNDYYIRGFQAVESFRNGFRDVTFISPRDVANIERVEFLKGPASVLYGGGFNLSGAVNTITKKPQTDPFYDLQGTIGNYDFYRTTVDFTGPFTQDKNLLYRLNVAYENSGSFRDFNENEGVFVAPSITWKIGKNTRLTVDFEYQNYDYVFDRGFTPNIPSDILFDLPISRFLGEPDFSRANFDSYYYSYNFEHEFDEQWKIRQGFAGLNVNGNVQNVQPTTLQEDNRTLNRRAEISDEYTENYSLQTEVIGKFKTDSIEHNLLFGVEYARYKFSYDFIRASIDPLDIFNPIYGAKPGKFFPAFAQEYGTNNIGIYLQDLVYLTPNVIVLLGGRYDWTDNFYRDRNTGDTFSETSDNEFSPRLGLVYKPTENTSLYFSWARSFLPTTFGGASRTGELFEPETGEQVEIGVKQDFLEGRLSATLAFYNLTRKNVLTTDPVDPNFSIQTGEQTSNGIELDLTGEILPGWNIIANYAYTNAYVSKDNNIPEGDRLAGVPRNTASLWTTYEIQGGNLQGLGFGLGLYYVDQREGRLPNNDLQLPSYFRTDASIFYRRDNYEANLSFKNLFSEKIYQTQGFFVTPSAPFTVLANFKIKF
ncbi:TonB-dependent siderophore receptor [Cyanobacterium aponinum UTEX 3221]|uniref:TonB-dependent siderophore receptor n=1 Tax=Cyanobacterium aponinum TaxID=379064 RepID=UPI002B4BF4BD|nr:TonB-dependent siderophore receptor [Cyanobacterium aponinum]WRL38563.1 TonB-dependent siderophore receptor [Cyanobacterium aponinum UTEX 3221]